MRRVWKVAVILTLLVGVGYAGFVAYVSARSADSLIHPGRPSAWDEPFERGLAFEEAAFETSDGLDLVGWWIPAENASATVVVLHGYGESKAQALDYAPFLHNASLNVLAFDFRAHGESEGSHTTVGMDETMDVSAAVAYARGRSAAPLALFGLSMGAATAINSAGALPEVRAIVSDSSFATLENIASNSITHFTGLPKFPYGPLSVAIAAWRVDRSLEDDQPVRAIASLRVPVLIIQGEEDTIALARDDGQALRDAYPAADYWLVPGAAHVQAHDVARSEYESRVTAFLHESIL